MLHAPRKRKSEYAAASTHAWWWYHVKNLKQTGYSSTFSSGSLVHQMQSHYCSVSVKVVGIISDNWALPSGRDVMMTESTFDNSQRSIEHPRTGSKWPRFITWHRIWRCFPTIPAEKSCPCICKYGTGFAPPVTLDTWLSVRRLCQLSDPWGINAHWCLQARLNLPHDLIPVKGIILQLFRAQTHSKHTLLWIRNNFQYTRITTWTTRQWGNSHNICTERFLSSCDLPAIHT